jgi:phosphoadenosine phosphosulfate reductase
MALDSTSQFEADPIVIPAEVSPEDALSCAVGHKRVDIVFDSFKDGRGFSLAAHLRKAGFAGELRAIGPLLPDQISALRRVGFDTVLSGRIKAGGRSAHPAFGSVYQPDPTGIGAAVPAYRRRALAARRATAEALAEALEGASPELILDLAIKAYRGRIAVLSSFGAEAALGLMLVAGIDPATPVLFLETQRHFPQTLQYKDTLIERLGLTDVRIIKPDPDEAAREDADGRLYVRDSLACCALRKVRPLAGALEAFDAVITGRKRHHGGSRSTVRAVEFDGERVRINPLAHLTADEIFDRFTALGLPDHPLVEAGYASIGCWPCTAHASIPGSRDGRWAGQDRTECGIFDPEPGQRAERVKSVRLI